MSRNELFGNRVQQQQQQTQDGQYHEQDHELVFQQQQQQQYNYNNEEEYLAAQRASIEAIQIGRETLNVTVQQREQLHHAETIADETQYKIDTAGRILRGMTWSGWLANKFTKPTTYPSSSNNNNNNNNNKQQRREPPLVYDQDTLPASTRTVTQALQNYHANVNVLEACETEEQKQTCQTICNSMYKIAHQELSNFQNMNNGLEAYALEFALDLKVLRERQLSSQQQIRNLDNFIVQSSIPNNNTNGSIIRSNDSTNQRNELMQQASVSSSVSTGLNNANTDSPSAQILQRQENHLTTISQTLGELNFIANSLSSEFHNQNQVIDKLGTQSENILDSSRMVTRRAERLIQQKSWTPAKPQYSCDVSIRHIRSGKYLGIDPAAPTSLLLVSEYRPKQCSFEVWKRPNSTLFGFKNQATKKFIGQTFLGGMLSCSATAMDRREEIEADVNDTTTIDFAHQPTTSNVRLLLASAGWGHGAYLVVSAYDEIKIGNSSLTPQERNNADRWCITNLHYTNDP